MRVAGGAATGNGAGEGRLNVVNDNLVRGRASRVPMLESGRDGGALPGDGEDGLLEGRKNEGLLSACIIASEVRRYRPGSKLYDVRSVLFSSTSSSSLCGSKMQ